MMKTNKAFAGIVSVALICAAVVANQAKIMEAIGNNGTEIAARETVVITEEPETVEKKEASRIVLNLSKENRFENYTIYYGKDYEVATSLNELVAILNRDTNDVYLLDEAGHLMRIDSGKTVVNVDIDTMVSK